MSNEPNVYVSGSTGGDQQVHPATTSRGHQDVGRAPCPDVVEQLRKLLDARRAVDGSTGGGALLLILDQGSPLSDDTLDGTASCDEIPFQCLIPAPRYTGSAQSQRDNDELDSGA